MGFGDQPYKLVVRDPRNGDSITSGVSVYVYTAGTKTLATIYSNNQRGSKTNPTTFTAFDGTINFWSAATTVDIFLADDKGNVSFVPSVSPTDHTLPLNRDGVDKCFVAPFSANTSETDTGLDFPLNTLIYKLAVEVVTVDATETMDVGLLSTETAGDADGLLAAVDVATAAFITPFVITDGSNEDFVASPYYGALMGLGSAGTDVANDFGQGGGAGHIVSGSNAQSLTYTHSAGSDTAAGYIYAWFKHLR